MIAIDTETGLATNQDPIPPLVSVAMSPGRLLHHTEGRACGAVADALGGETVFMNAPFDLTVLGHKWPELWPLIIEALAAGRVHDVAIREKLIDIAEGERRHHPYNLGAIAERRAGIAVDKNDPWRMHYIQLYGVPIERWPEAAKTYAITDAAATLAVYEKQAEINPIVFVDEARQVRKAMALWSQTLEGIATDQAHAVPVLAALATRIEAGGKELERAGLARIKGTKLVCDTKAAAAAMVVHCHGAGIIPAETATGGVALNEKALARARIPEGHALDVYRRFKALKALSTRMQVLRRPVVRPRYDSLKETGRTGCSAPQGKRKLATVKPWEWVGTNLQNLPREGGFRECLIPPPGCVFVVSDWSGAELVGFSQIEIDLFGRSVMGAALAEGLDAHRFLACTLLGIPYSAYDPKIKEHKARRQFAKIPNFGFLGGLGAARFVEFAAGFGASITEAEAKTTKRQWLDTWQTRPYFAEMSRRVDEGGVFIQHRSGRIRGGCRFTEMCNTPFQGIAADAAGDALWQLWLAARDPGSVLYGCPQVLFVHDENVTLAPVDRADEVLAEQERLMVEAFGRWCPDVPIKVESHIVDRYLKC